MTAWLMTYFLHSSILIGAVALVSRSLHDRWLPLKETLWRTAVFGSLLTASLQVGLGIEPLGGSWGLSSKAESPRVATNVMESATAVSANLQSSVTPDLAQSRIPSASAAFEPMLLAAWTLGAFVLSTLLAIKYARLEARLARSRQVVRGPTFERFQRLVEPAGFVRPVRLSTSSQIEVPLAKGWCRPEICVPARVTLELPLEQQESILAHELAHLKRHDPLWLAILRLTEAVLFFQPLNRLARRQLQETAEYRCDDWAANNTGRPLTMARCLANVAEWTLCRQSDLPAPALTSRGQMLTRRVDRLLDGHYPLPYPPRQRWLIPVVVTLLVSTVLVVPGFSLADSAEEPQPVAQTPVAPEDQVSPDSPVVPVAVEVVPVEAVQVPAVAPPAEPTAPPSVERVRPVEGRRQSLEAQRQAREAELRRIDETLRQETRSVEAEARRLERDLVRQMERVERIPLKEIEQLELELQEKVRLHEQQIKEIEALHKELQETVDRHLKLQEAELEQLREERERQRLERDEKRREEPQSP
jgi:hypothetical protein